MHIYLAFFPGSKVTHLYIRIGRAFIASQALEIDVPAKKKN